jgi:GNAT superfamily N-acetyltransferase
VKSSPLSCRKATRDDVEAIARLHAESWRKTYRKMLDDAFLDGPVFEDRLAVWSKRLTQARDDQFVVVVEEGGALAGFGCVYAHEDPTWGSFLDNLHAHPDRHRAGIGRSLMREIVTWCRSNAPDCGLYLWVFGLNLNARAFYARLGATDVGFDIRTPDGGTEPREIHRYVWPTLDDVRL